MIRKSLYIVALVLTLMPQVAQASSTTQVTMNEPYSDACVGRNMSVYGTAFTDVSGADQIQSWNWTLQFRATGGSTWQYLTQGNNMVRDRSNPVATVSALNLPSPLDLRLMVTVRLNTRPAQTYFGPTHTNIEIDKIKPGPPSNLTVRATSRDEAYLTWQNGVASNTCQDRDPVFWAQNWNIIHHAGDVHCWPGCSPPFAFDGNSQFGEGMIQLYGENQHINAYFVTPTGNDSVETSPVDATPRPDAKTTLAGHVTESQYGTALYAVVVTARNAAGVVVGSTWTDGAGWYTLALDGTADPNQPVSYTVTYAKPGYQVVTDVDTLYGQGDILIRHQVLRHV